MARVQGAITQGEMVCGAPQSLSPTLSLPTGVPMDYPPRTECPVLVYAVDAVPSSRQKWALPGPGRHVYSCSQMHPSPSRCEVRGIFLDAHVAAFDMDTFGAQVQRHRYHA